MLMRYDRFRGMHMIDASNVISIESGLADIGLDFGLENADAKATLNILSRTEEEWLLLFDNADDPHLDHLRGQLKRAKRGTSPILRPLSPRTEIGLTTLASCNKNPYLDVQLGTKCLASLSSHVTYTSFYFFIFSFACSLVATSSRV